MASDANGRPRARLSVLDRLVEESPSADGGEASRRTVTGDELKRLVRRDLEWLLSTRRTVQRNGSLGRAKTVTEYGIPDFAPVSPSDQRALNYIAHEVRMAIEAFEPRLQDVTVQVESALEPGRVMAHIEALLVAGDVRRPVAFPFTIRTSG